MVTVKARVVHLTAWLLLLTASLVSEDQPIYNGQNILKPITRFDTRLAYQKGVEDVLGNCVILTLRTDKVVDLADDWQLSFRIDVPYSWFSCPQSQLQAGCSPDDHLTDVLVQALVITPPIDKWTFGGGTQVLFPTDGGNTEIGDAKYELIPSVGVAYDLDDWSPGAYCGLTLRQSWSVGGYASAPLVSRTYIQPYFNVNLNRNWFINLSPEMRYNWETPGWFVPLDIMVGWMITPKILASIEYEYGLVTVYHRFSQEVEFRLGYFF